MNTSNLTDPRLLSGDPRIKTIDQIEAVQNLLYLIGVDAGDVAKVRGYAEEADRLLLEMQRQVLEER